MKRKKSLTHISMLIKFQQPNFLAACRCLRIFSSLEHENKGDLLSREVLTFTKMKVTKSERSKIEIF